MNLAQIRKATFAVVLTILAKIGDQHHKPVEQMNRELAVTVKNVVIPLEVEYLQAAAKQRGVSRTRLVRAVMQKVVQDELVADILGDPRNSG